MRGQNEPRRCGCRGVQRVIRVLPVCPHCATGWAVPRKSLKEKTKSSVSAVSQLTVTSPRADPTWGCLAAPGSCRWTCACRRARRGRARTEPCDRSGSSTATPASRAAGRGQGGGLVSVSSSTAGKMACCVRSTPSQRGSTDRSHRNSCLSLPSSTPPSLSLALPAPTLAYAPAHRVVWLLAPLCVIVGSMKSALLWFGVA